jgi:imidazoleglycerol-phosphate dehydratase
MRKAEIKRKTAETDIVLSLNLDGVGKSVVDTGCGFLDHMLTLFAKHGRFDLTIKCVGDVNVDYHHTTEDIGICLGKAFTEALGDKKGIVRYGSTILPMDEALILTAVDISGRGMLVKDLDIKANKVGDFDTELLEEFLIAFTRNADATIHVRQISGSNAHHIIEGAFKSLARSLKTAV